MKKCSGDIFLSANESFFLVEQTEEQLVGFLGWSHDIDKNYT